MKHGEQYGEWPEEELPKELFDMSVIRTRVNAKKVCKCFDRSFIVDPINKFVECSKCGAIIDPFEAIYEIARNKERMVEENKRILEQRKQIQSYKPYLVAIKNLEKESRSGKMVPTCPHCSKPFRLDQLNTWVSKEYCNVKQVD
jgi:DNA-directed RNA polymerase subunit RPC12/RpoP